MAAFGSRGGRGAGKPGAKGAVKKKVFFRRRKVCKFCADHLDYIDYKDAKQVQQFILERAKILPRRISGTCARHQRMVQQAIKRARHLALVPFTTD